MVTMQLAARVPGLVFVSALPSGCFAADTVTSAEEPWPQEHACESCVPVLFGELDVRLPLAEIDKILVMNSDSSALTILPPSGVATESAFFLTVRPE